MTNGAHDKRGVSRIRGFATLLFMVVGLAAWLPAHAAAPQVPSGIYALAQAGRPVMPALLSHPHVAGIVLRSTWADVEPEDGRFDWRELDAQFERVAASGKVASLVVTAGGVSVPAWLMPRLGPPVRFVDDVRFHRTHGQTLAVPTFWDPVLLERKRRLIAALGERYAGRTELRLVSVQCANATTDDWNIPGGEAAVAAWRSAGFTRERMRSACAELVGATAAAFPRQALRMAVGRVPQDLDGDPDALAREVVRDAAARLPGRFFVQRHNLSARSPGPADGRTFGWAVLAEACPACAAQFLWPVVDTQTCRANGGNRPCDPASTFRAAADTALAYGLRYVEVYGADLQAPALDAEVERLAQGLARGAPAGPARALKPVVDEGPPRAPRLDLGPGPRPRAGPMAADPGVQQLSFQSKAYGGPRRFGLWLPESYATGDRRYPVLYWLHGKGGDPQRSSHLVQYLRRAIADGRMPEVIMVFPDGDTDRFYTDDPDKRSPVETMIIDELIPHIDATYRTVAERRGRLLEGFSMGGFGALKFAAKYPEKFASVVAYGAPRLDASMGMRGGDAEIYEKVFAGDAERFRRETPAHLFREHRARVLASGLRIRIVAGGADGTRHSVRLLHDTLQQLGIAHEFVEWPGVRHVPAMYYDADAGAGFALHARALSER